MDPDPDPVFAERLDPGAVCPERLDPVNVRPAPKPLVSPLVTKARVTARSKRKEENGIKKYSDKCM